MAAPVMVELPLDALYDRLAALPHALWLPGLTCMAWRARLASMTKVARLTAMAAIRTTPHCSA